MLQGKLSQKPLNWNLSKKGPGMALPMGGHLTHGWDVSVTGRWFRPVRYGVRRTLGREVDGLTVHVDGVEYTPAVTTPAPIRRETNVHPRGQDDRATDVD